MRCDMCGSEEELLYKTDIEGANMNVCKGCSRYGDIISKVEKPEPEEVEEKKEQQVEEKEPEKLTLVVDDYPSRIKKKRERRGLKQEEMAHQLGVKTSVIKHLETGDMEPSMDLAKKIGKFLKITLVEEVEDKAESGTQEAAKELTVGDIVQIKE